MLCLGIVGTGVGYLLHWTMLARHPTAASIIGFVLVISGIAVSAVCIFFLWKRPVALIIDRQGILRSPGRPAARVPWSDLKGAHLAIHEGTPIVALELADPSVFYQRSEGRWRRWYIGLRPDYIPIRYADLDTTDTRLMYIIQEGIRRQGRPAR